MNFKGNICFFSLLQDEKAFKHKQVKGLGSEFVRGKNLCLLCVCREF